jgi:hypothetical protein
MAKDAEPTTRARERQEEIRVNLLKFFDSGFRNSKQQRRTPRGGMGFGHRWALNGNHVGAKLLYVCS